MDNIEARVQHLFQQARTQPVTTTPDEVFGTFLSSLAGKGTGLLPFLFNLNNLIIMLSTSAILVAVFLWNPVETAQSQDMSQPAATAAMVQTTAQDTARKTGDTTRVTTAQPAPPSPARPQPENPTPEISQAPAPPVPPAIAATSLAPEPDPDTVAEPGWLAGDTAKTTTPPKDTVAQAAGKSHVRHKNCAHQRDCHTDDDDQEQGTIISYVISNNTTFDEMEKIAAEAHKAGLMMRYDLKIRKNKIRRMRLHLRYAGGDMFSHNSSIVANGTFIRNIGWEVDDQGRAIRILK